MIFKNISPAAALQQFRNYILVQAAFSYHAYRPFDKINSKTFPMMQGFMAAMSLHITGGIERNAALT
jgi:hypothetical protein